MITILGPTASGKTQLAVQTALRLNGEIISADSRQVYKGMNLGTGKDLQEYTVGNKTIPYHIIDIKEPGYEYNVFEFQQDFLKAYEGIKTRNHLPVFCGGTGMYLEAVLRQYNMQKVPENRELRQQLAQKSNQELVSILASLKEVHNTTDTEDRERLLRAIEIQQYAIDFPQKQVFFPAIQSSVFGILYNRNELRERITLRLQQRLQQGMVQEVETLLQQGVAAEKLLFYGLEYRYLTLYLTNQLTYNQMFDQLNIAIHQFAKRQMTWFRRMEKNGICIHWINGELPLEDKMQTIIECCQKLK